MSSSEQSAKAAGRIHNFSAGPGALPLAVLEEAQRDFLNYKGAGMSVLEMSHRSKTYDRIIKQAEADLRELLGVPEGYAVLFLQGGASLQFSMVPMNLLPSGGAADYIVTGAWSQAVSQASTAKRSSGSIEVESASTMPRATVHSSGLVLWLRSSTNA